MNEVARRVRSKAQVFKYDVFRLSMIESFE